MLQPLCVKIQYGIPSLDILFKFGSHAQPSKRSRLFGAASVSRAKDRERQRQERQERRALRSFWKQQGEKGVQQNRAGERAFLLWIETSGKPATIARGGVSDFFSNRPAQCLGAVLLPPGEARRAAKWRGWPGSAWRNALGIRIPDMDFVYHGDFVYHAPPETDVLFNSQLTQRLAVKSRASNLKNARSSSTQTDQRISTKSVLRHSLALFQRILPPRKCFPSRNTAR